MNKAKAIVLLSGGLDSMLAAKTLMEQGIEVVGVCFESNFFDSKKAQIAADELGIELITKDISDRIIELVKNPPNGYGKHLNPCIDCHGLMIKEAEKIRQEKNFDIIATGEVYDQRPFSQTLDSLERVQEIAGVDVLRPLSALNLPETVYENKGLVDRSKLLDIHGRTRREQNKMAKKSNLKNFATPAGGCLLTDPEFSERLNKMLDYWLVLTKNDIELIKRGRVFWLTIKHAETQEKKILVIIGRHEQDNERLEKLAKQGDIVLELKEINGPTTIIRGLNNEKTIYEKEVIIPKELKKSELGLSELKTSEEIIETTTLLTGYYATKARGKEVIIKVSIK